MAVLVETVEIVSSPRRFQPASPDERDAMPLTSFLQVPIIKFLREEAPKTLYFIVIMSSISGAAGGAILAIINSAASVEAVDGEPGDGQHRLLLLFVVTLATLIISKWISFIRSTEVVEEMLNRLRVRICDKIRKSELETIESLSESEVFTTIARDTGMISQAVKMFANVCQQSLLLVAGMFYLLWLSQTASVLFAVAGSASAYFYWMHLGDLRKAFQQDHEKQSEFFAYLTHLLSGFKELSLSQQKSDEIFVDMTEVAQQAKAVSVRTGSIFARTMLFSDVTLYLLLGSIVFILPQLSETYSETLVKTTIAVMFVFGPLGTVIGTLPQLTNAGAALDNLYNLEKRLDEKLADSPAGEPRSGLFDDFRQIVSEGIEFSYKDPDGSTTFQAGPFDLEIERGEILFIVGGNGSGKTTLLKLLTGLYHPQSGLLKIDGRPITGSNRREYRGLFAGVLSDFHLFERLYGVGEIDEGLAVQLLEKMEIAEKVEIVEGRFSTLDLSTGQRKRLALVASLLEDRQVYVFDEWSADQDPHFRAHFYGTIVPELRQQGKTIIAITHDDRYWNIADRLLKLDYGRIDSIQVLE